jgi:hypothetical protein
VARLRSLSLLGGLLILSLGAAAGCKKGAANNAGPLEQVAQAPAGRGQAKDEDGKAPGKDLVARKIIYTGSVRLIVEDFGKAAQELERLLEAHKGHIVHAHRTDSPGSPRSGEWKVRVPAGQFKAFEAAVIKLGELQSSTLDSQDVTEEFSDLQTRIKNRTAREDALRQMYQTWEKKAQKPADLLPIDTELKNLRLEIEREQGRLQLLRQLTEMTTVTVLLYERGAYVPPEAATLGTKAGRTFSGSLEALGTFGEGLLLILVALAPWLLVVAAVVVPIWVAVRRQRRHAAAGPAPSPPVVAAAPPRSPGPGPGDGGPSP